MGKIQQKGLGSQIQDVWMGSRRQGQQPATRTPGVPCSRSCTAKYTWCPRRWWGAPRCSGGWTPETRWSMSLSTSFAPNPQYGVGDGGDYGVQVIALAILVQVFHSIQLHNLTMWMGLSKFLDTFTTSWACGSATENSPCRSKTWRCVQEWDLGDTSILLQHGNSTDAVVIVSNLLNSVSSFCPSFFFL